MYVMYVLNEAIMKCFQTVQEDPDPDPDKGL